MTMTVKEWLFRLKELKDDAERIERELERSGPGNSKKNRELRKKLEKTRSEYLEEYDAILRGINGLDSHVLRQIMKKRYLDQKPFWKIARELGYAEQYIKNMHSKALKEFSRVMEKGMKKM